MFQIAHMFSINQPIYYETKLDMSPNLFSILTHLWNNGCIPYRILYNWNTLVQSILPYIFLFIRYFHFTYLYYTYVRIICISKYIRLICIIKRTKQPTKKWNRSCLEWFDSLTIKISHRFLRVHNSEWAMYDDVTTL